MKVRNVQLSTIITPKTTGYTAAAGMGLSICTALSKNSHLKKAHKPISYLTALLTILHVGLIEYYHYKFRAK